VLLPSLGSYVAETTCRHYVWQAKHSHHRRKRLITPSATRSPANLRTSSLSQPYTSANGKLFKWKNEIVVHMQSQWVAMSHVWLNASPWTGKKTAPQDKAWCGLFIFCGAETQHWDSMRCRVYVLFIFHHSSPHRMPNNASNQYFKYRIKSYYTRSQEKHRSHWVAKRNVREMWDWQQKTIEMW